MRYNTVFVTTMLAMSLYNGVASCQYVERPPSEYRRELRDYSRVYPPDSGHESASEFSFGWDFSTAEKFLFAGCMLVGLVCGLFVAETILTRNVKQYYPDTQTATFTSWAQVAVICLPPLFLWLAVFGSLSILRATYGVPMGLIFGAIIPLLHGPDSAVRNY